MKCLTEDQTLPAALRLQHQMDDRYWMRVARDATIVAVFPFLIACGFMVAKWVWQGFRAPKKSRDT